MKKLLISLLALSCIVLPIRAFSAKPAPAPVGGRVVILDPGHGGNEPGAVNGDLIEKNLNLDIARLARTRLEGLGYTVYLTREGDQTLTNNDRYTFANNKKGNLLVSIHLNSYTNPTVDGTETYYGKPGKDKAFADILQSSMVNTLGIANRGTAQFASGVLLKSNMPAAISEGVFMSNPTEYELLKSGNRQVQIADGIVGAVTQYLK